MKKLRDAMKKRKLSVADLVRLSGLSDQSVRNLLALKGATRNTVPLRVTAYTMVRILEIFPDITVQDFIPGARVFIKRARRLSRVQ